LLALLRQDFSAGEESSHGGSAASSHEEDDGLMKAIQLARSPPARIF